jgi:hypothetical protein
MASLTLTDFLKVANIEFLKPLTQTELDNLFKRISLDLSVTLFYDSIGRRPFVVSEGKSRSDNEKRELTDGQITRTNPFGVTHFTFLYNRPPSASVQVQGLQMKQVMEGLLLDLYPAGTVQLWEDVKRAIKGYEV